MTNNNQETNLQSSVNRVGDLVTQVIVFRDGVKKTYHNVLSSTIEDGTFCKFRTKTGQLILINTQNVLSIEVYPEGAEGTSV